VCVRSLREACVHWSDAHGVEKDSLPSGVAGAQIRHEIRAAFVAQSLLLAGLLLGSLAATLDRRGRRVALSNLRVAFGDEISTERREQIVRESYQHFARTMLDFFWSSRLTSQNFSRYGYARSCLSMIVRLRGSQRTS
jgi:lauroyl/myristoyl acyltransferase